MMNLYEFHDFSSLDVSEYPKSPCAIQGYHIVICNITVVTQWWMPKKGYYIGTGT